MNISLKSSSENFSANEEALQNKIKLKNPDV